MFSAWKKEMTKADDYASGLLILILIVAGVFFLKDLVTHTKSDRDLTQENFFIAIQGDIPVPGVYTFAGKPSLEKLISRGGGIEYDGINPSEFYDIPLSSGTAVTVKKEGNKKSISCSAMSAFYKVTLGIPISLNKETESGFTAIPGIGPVLAGRFVRERLERGGFKDLNDIKSIKGVGDKTYKKIVPYLELF